MVASISQGTLVSSAAKTSAPITGRAEVSLLRAGNPPAKRGAAKRKATTRPAKTFRRSALEASFIAFCQLQPKAEDRGLTQAEFTLLQSQANDFIVSEDFSARGSEKAILGDNLLDDGIDGQDPGKSRATRTLNLPPHLLGMCEDALLTPERERQLFRRMNFLRYLAAKLLDKKTYETTTQWDVERVHGLMRAAEWHRDKIVRANIRLVISIMKKFVNQQCGFDDLLSDGIMALIRSVDKFDYKLGFRFSTYATQVVRRNSYRFVMDRQDERLKVSNSISESGLDVAEDQDPSTMSEYRWNTLRSHLGLLLDRLDKREKLIVRARFSLGGHSKVQTLQALADRLGISKERVRQLEKRAIEKLQSMADRTPPDLAEADY